ncbi:unnamed protein product, partial [Gongylonema pulchrum]|uniref:Polyprotein n=1 Tax=Gongylonema pulchrum TaxID=637853 RepID=A0A183EGN7_9BILA
VRPKPFEEICSNGGATEHCTAASAYYEVCSNAGVDTSLPSDCVKCDNGLNLGEERKVEKPPTERDVVFVVEESKCLEIKCDNGLNLGEERKVEKPPTERDVVFVVEESKCLESQKDKVEKLAQRISREQRYVNCAMTYQRTREERAKKRK